MLLLHGNRPKPGSGGAFAFAGLAGHLPQNGQRHSPGSAPWTGSACRRASRASRDAADACGRRCRRRRLLSSASVGTQRSRRLLCTPFSLAASWLGRGCGRLSSQGQEGAEGPGGRQAPGCRPGSAGRRRGPRRGHRVLLAHPFGKHSSEDEDVLSLPRGRAAVERSACGPRFSPAGPPLPRAAERWQATCAFAGEAGTASLPAPHRQQMWGVEVWGQGDSSSSFWTLLTLVCARRAPGRPSVAVGLPSLYCPPGLSWGPHVTCPVACEGPSLGLHPTRPATRFTSKRMPHGQLHAMTVAVGGPGQQQPSVP